MQFTLEHTDFFDYVYSRNVKFSDLRYETLVGGVINWLNNLAQSNRQMNIDNDWAINLQVSRMTEILRSFGTEDPVADVSVNDEPLSSFSPRTVINVNIPHSTHSTDVLMEQDKQEDERLFGVSDDDNGNDENDDSDCGEDYYDEDAGTCKSFQNVVALQVLIDREITSSDKIVDYYFKAQTMKIGPRITFFLNISNLSKNYLIDFFYSVSNFGPGMVELKYQRAK